MDLFLSVIPVPEINRHGFRWEFDAPARYDFRIDPDGDRKAVVRRAEHVRIFGESFPQLPPLKTLHLQWRDTDWRDNDLHIDLGRMGIFREDQCFPFLTTSLRRDMDWLPFIAAPVVLTFSAYFIARELRLQSDERKHGMSRHGVALLRKLKGQLDATSEDLLTQALKNDWNRQFQVARKVDFREAEMLLSESVRTERLSLEARNGAEVRHLSWLDTRGMLIGHMFFIDGRTFACKVCGSWFEGEEAYALASCGRKVPVAD
jgi:hypothetical protein